VWNELSNEVDIRNNAPEEISFMLHKSIFDIDKNSFFKYIDWLSELLNLKPNDRLLEIGCGNGSLLLGLNQKVKIIPFGLDISQPLINVCHRIYPHFKDNFSVGTFPKENYEICLSNSVLQYLDETSVARIIKETKCQKIVFSDVKNVLFEDIFKSDQASRQGLTLKERNLKYLNTPLKHYSENFFRGFEYKIDILPMPEFYPDSNYGSFTVVINK
tara:strand:+ start:391 stop:1038 length:648 start_codon:yes stop_codon:yes gene_type:complete